MHQLQLPISLKRVNNKFEVKILTYLRGEMDEFVF